MRTSFIRKSLVAGLTGISVLGAVGCEMQRKPIVEATEATSETPMVPSEEMEATEDEGQPISSLNEQMLGKSVAVEGEVIRQCPAAGCWFQVKDGTGELFIDLNEISVRVREPRVGQQAKVSGKLVKVGGELQLEAERVEFARK